MKVYISATLRSFFGRNSEFDLEQNTIKDILNLLVEEYPEAKKGLYEEDGRLRSFIKIYVDDEDKTDISNHEKEINKESNVLLLPVIAGGSPNESIISDERRKAVTLDDSDIERFNKHLLLREIGVKGQKRIKAARVVVIGAGALGSPVIQYLAAAGIGTIKVVDFDKVSLENLQSQVIHGIRDVKRPKTASARDTIRNVNRGIDVIVEDIKIEADNIASVIDGFDIVIDCTDNYKSRYLISDACVLLGIPLIYGAVYQYEGYVTVLVHNDGPCLRCIFPSPPPAGLVPTCAEGGTISTLPGIVGSIQANEALKLIIGIGEHLTGELLTIDSLGLRSNKLKVKKDCNCPICGKNKSIFEIQDFDYEDFCGLKEDDSEIPVEGFTPEELAHKLERGEQLTIVDVREPHERAIRRFPNALIIPIGQLARRQKELNPEIDTVFICKEGKRSILAINTLREAGYKGAMYNLKGGLDAMTDIIFSNEGGRL